MSARFSSPQVFTTSSAVTKYSDGFPPAPRLWRAGSFIVMSKGSSFIKENPRPEFSNWSELKPKSKIIPSTLSIFISKSRKFLFIKTISQPLNLSLAFSKTLLSWSRAIIFTLGHLLQISRLCPPPPKVASTITRFSFPAFCGASRPSIVSFKRTVLCISQFLRQLFRFFGHFFFLLRPCFFVPNFHSVFNSDNCRFVPEPDAFLRSHFPVSPPTVPLLWPLFLFAATMLFRSKLPLCL